MLALFSESWGALEASWGALGASWRVLAASWGVFGPSWRPLGASWGVLGASWRVLAASWRVWTRLGRQKASKSLQHKPVQVREREARFVFCFSYGLVLFLVRLVNLP